MAHDKRPFRQDHQKMRGEAEVDGAPPEPIPGERDRTTELPTDSAIVWSMSPGSNAPLTNADVTLDEAATQDREWEGGGKRP